MWLKMKYSSYVSLFGTQDSMDKNMTWIFFSFFKFPVEFFTLELEFLSIDTI